MKKMTERKKRILDAFVTAFELEVKPDFSSQPPQAVYSGLIYAGDRLSQEELMDMPEYVGFVDGCEHHPEKFRGPRGSPDRQEEPGIKPIARVQVFMKKGLDGFFKKDDYKIKGNVGMSGNEERYHNGYVKGSASEI